MCFCIVLHQRRRPVSRNMGVLGRRSSFSHDAPVVPFYLAPLRRRSPSCLAHIAAVTLCQRAVRVVVVNNGGIGRRIIISRYRRGLGPPRGCKGPFPWSAGLGSQQAAVGETYQTRKVGLGRWGAGCRRAKARQHRPCVERGPVPAAPARGGGEAQPAERCWIRVERQWGGE